MNNSYKKAMDKIKLSDEQKEKIISNASKPQINQISKFRPVSIKRLAGLAACFVFCFLSYYAVTNYDIQTPTKNVSVDTPNPTPNHEASSEKMATSGPVQEKSSLKVIPDSKTEGAINNSEESMVINPFAYERAKVNENQTETISPKQEVAIEDHSSADNGLPPFAKGKAVIKDDVDHTAVTEQTATDLVDEIKFPQKVPAGYDVANISVAEERIAEITYQSENDIITYRTAKSSENLSQKNDAYEFMEIVHVNHTDIVLKGNEELYYYAVWSDNEESFSITSNNGVEKSVIVDMVSSVDYTEQTNTNIEN